MGIRKLLAVGTLAAPIAFAASAHAQHQHQQAPPVEQHPMPEGEQHRMTEGERGMQMMRGVLGIPMTRQGSGTAWLPDDSPMRAFHFMVGGWTLMVHGNAFVGYDHQGTDAGDDELVSQNWIMAMANHPLAGGVFDVRAMLSLEPLTVGKDGYPLLLQTGESVNGMPLVDRQHPHDLFMELAADYQRQIAGGVAVEVYGAVSGEPALGPVAFPHRPSAMSDPLAPLSHHWQDSTHISFGVITAGLFTRFAKLEGSWFNGREPDEDRWDIDLRGFDSCSARLTVNPNRSWSVQASYGFLDSPEELEPTISIHRVTASAIHALRIDKRRSWTSSLVWGRNIASARPNTDALLAESALDLGTFGVTFARAEYVVKTGDEFGFPAPMADDRLPLGNLAAGHVHPIVNAAGVELGLGARGAVGYVDAELEARYGSRWVWGFMAYLQLHPVVMH